MSNDDKDLPVSSDFQKSQENKGPQLPEFLTSKFGALVGLSIVVVIVGLTYAFSHVSVSRPEKNPMDSRPGFASLRQHVASLAEVDHICMGGSERVACLCELNERIRDDYHAIDAVLAADPSLKAFSITVQQPESATYTYEKLPKAPGESECLNAVSAPTIIDDDSAAQ
jgi:hypothetical protein